MTAFSQLQTFSSTHSSTAPDRNSETPATNQFDVPSTAVGGALQWSKRIASAHLLLAGADFRWIEGEANEDFAFSAALNQFTQRRNAGGEQQLAGMYVQDIFTPTPQWQITLAGRVDLWRSINGSRFEWSLQTGSTTREEEFPDRTELAFSPMLGLLYRATDRLSVRGSFYQGFRAPTINELYRPFRTRGNVVTEANAALDPERLIGGEAGVDYVLGDTLFGRLTGFWNEVEDPISDVTIRNGPGNIPPCGPVPAGGVCRQRQNLDRARTRGIEVELEYRPRVQWAVSGSYLFDDSKVVSAPNQLQLEGKRVAAVPKHQFTLKLSYSNPALLNASVQGRYVGDQFADDLNTLKLGNFFVVDLLLARQIRAGWEAFLGAENLFDRRYEVDKTTNGTVTIGAPILVHGGLRASF